jgi:GT2 family glycosyltransferase
MQLYDTQNDKSSKSNSFSTDKIEVSIIIPSYNKYPLNLLTLYSLEKQNFDFSKMEVLLIDDASTDQTSEYLENYQPPYHFNYIRAEENNGRAKVRNIGIQQSRGNILIFLDAEMMTEPNFVKNHYKLQKNEDNLIVSGAMNYKALYTCIFPSITSKELQVIEKLVKNDPQLFQRFSNYSTSINTPFLLLDKQDIDNKKYKNLTVKKSNWYKTIIKAFGSDLSGFSFPWMGFLTGNVSIRKDLIESVGAFDEEFVLYGYEDWELGYRLYNAGGKYIASNKVITYHQEHPVSTEKWKEAIINYNLFISKHPNIDILILGLELSRFTDLISMNKVLAEYKTLVNHHPEEFHSFREKFIEILKTIALLLKIDIRHFNVLGAAGYDSDQRAELLNDIAKLKKYKQFNTLSSVVEKIINT